MKTTLIPFKKAGFSDLIDDYFSKDSALRPFYEHSPEISSFPKAIENRKQHPANRQVLADVLAAQYAAAGISNSNIQTLLQENTYTVTTGHQLNIFTGPLYFIYKIVTVVKLAQELEKAYPGNHFVPVYWMASEDHDIAEINHTSVFGKPLAWETTQKGPAGRLSTNDMQATLAELKTILGESPEAQELYTTVEKAYNGNASLASATRAFVHELFGKYGLVIVDADHQELKALFADVMYKDITGQHSYRLINETIKALEPRYKAQVSPREINFFYMENNLRERIVKEDGRYKVLNSSISFSEEELKEAISKHPERFSPNVATRPLYQEVILPNLAYIGGPAEIAYWMEFAGVFKHYNIPFPVLMLRNCLLWVDEGNAAKMEKLKLSAEELFEDTDILLNNYTRAHSEEDLSLADESAKLAALFETVINKAAQVDPTLKAPAEGEKQKQLAALQMIEGRMVKAQKKKQETTLSQVRSLQEKLFPGGGLQERNDNFLPYYLKNGEKFMELLLSNSNPFERNFVVMGT